MGNYEDGGGAEVRTAFTKRDLNLFLGWTPDDQTQIELSYENNRTEDALFPGAGMDAPWDENQLYRLQVASNSSRPDGRWVGNPGLDASQHHQLDLGVSSLSKPRQISAVAFFDSASDFILRDRARGQPGILRADGASIYRNVAAELYGLEVDLWQRLARHVSRRGGRCG